MVGDVGRGGSGSNEESNADSDDDGPGSEGHFDQLIFRNGYGPGYGLFRSGYHPPARHLGRSAARSCGRDSDSSFLRLPKRPRNARTRTRAGDLILLVRGLDAEDWKLQTALGQLDIGWSSK